VSAGIARGSAYRTLGRAWAALTVALAVHVADEAASGFLAVYDPAVARIRAALPFIPVPTFTFTLWLGGLVLLVVVVALATPLMFKGAIGARGASFLHGTLMTLNGLGHAAGPLYFGDLLPGTLSAPLLFAAAVWLVWAAGRERSGSKRRV